MKSKYKLKIKEISMRLKNGSILLLGILCLFAFAPIASATDWTDPTCAAPGCNTYGPVWVNPDSPQDSSATSTDPMIYIMDSRTSGPTATAYVESDLDGSAAIYGYSTGDTATSYGGLFDATAAPGLKVNDGVVITPMVANPTYIAEGLLYLNSGTNQFRYYGGGAWRILNPFLTDGNELYYSLAAGTARGVAIKSGDLTGPNDAYTLDVYRKSQSTSDRAVYGRLELVGTTDYVSGTLGGYSNATGFNQPTGVIGKADTTDGVGVYGDGGSNGGLGGYFNTDHNLGVGVRGNASATGAAALNYGGYFVAAGDNGRGVYGVGNGSSGIGVLGQTSGSSGIGVSGNASATGVVVNTGGQFSSSGDFGRGVYAVTNGTSGVGVYAVGPSTPTSTAYALKLDNGAMAMEELGTLPTNVASYGMLYVKSSDSKLYFKDEAGTEYDLTGGGSGTIGDGTATGQMAFWNNTSGAWENTETNELVWNDTNKNVGINIASPTSTNKLHVVNSDTTAASTAVYGDASGTGAIVNYGGSFSAAGDFGSGVYGYAGATGAVTNYGGQFVSYGTSGVGVRGYAAATGSANNRGVVGLATGNSGVGVHGSASATGANVNYGGSFSAAGDSGVGVYAAGPSTPTSTAYALKLDNGAISMEELGTLPTNVGNYGMLYVKSSDSKIYFKTDGGVEYDLTGGSGSATGDNGTAAGQMNFWDGSKWTYTETSEMVWDDTNKRLGVGVASPGHKLHVVNSSSTGYLSAIYGVSSATGALENYGGYFSAASDSGMGVVAMATGSNGQALYGQASGVEGYGVRGIATSASSGSYVNAGGWFSSAGINGRAVYGESSANGGAVTNYGGYFTAAGGAGIAVYGNASGTTATNFGGFFQADGSGGRGIYARATGANGVAVEASANNTGAGTQYGGNFSAAGQTGVGIRASATNSGAFVNYGGYFTAAGTATGSAGVYGSSSSASNTTYGGHFTTSSPTGYGVYGVASGSTNINYGGYFTAAGQGGYGVYGASTNGTGTSYGGYFTSAGASGRGIFAEASAASGTTYGGYFSNASSGGYGVYSTLTSGGSSAQYAGYFTTSSTGGRGIYATSPYRAGDFYTAGSTGSAVYGYSAGTGTTYGGYFYLSDSNNTGRAVYGWNSGTSSSAYGGYFQVAAGSGTALYGSNTDTTNGYAADFTGRVRTSSKFITNVSDTAAAPGFTWNGDDNMGIYRVTTDTIGFSTAGTERMTINANGNIAASVSTGYTLNVDQSSTGTTIGSAALAVRRTGGSTSDGLTYYLANFVNGASSVGDIRAVNTTVTYTAFTGSHFAWTDENLDLGMLVEMNGNNKRHSQEIDSESVYGVKMSTKANSSKLLGSYLAAGEYNLNADIVDNPDVIMAVGNGDMWVADNGSNLEVGDYLISSDVPGHAMKVTDKYPVAYVVARVAENVDWSKVEEKTEDGIKHKKISVLFESFILNQDLGLAFDKNQNLDDLSWFYAMEAKTPVEKAIQNQKQQLDALETKVEILEKNSDSDLMEYIKQLEDRVEALEAEKAEPVKTSFWSKLW